MKKWLTYDECKTFLKQFNLTTIKDFNNIKNGLPNNIPKFPYGVYKNKGTWISWGDLLSTIDKKSFYLPYNDVKMILSDKKFKNRKSFFTYIQSNDIKEIPNRPDIFYKEWEDWGTFLSNGNKCTREVVFMPLESILKLIKENSIKNRKEWIIFYSKYKNVYDIPFSLSDTYNKSYLYFFRNIPNNMDYLFNYKQIEYLCDYYHVNSTKCWENLRKYYKRVPAKPSYYNKFDGFSNKFYSYREAKEFLINLGICDIYKWIEFIKKKPKFIPRHPDDFYDEWIGWGDFLRNEGMYNSKSSIGEHNIMNYLDGKNIIYETQKTFDGCKYIKPLRFDFYLPDYNMCIEYDGKQHFQPIEYFGGEEYFNKIKIRDSIKNQFCINSKIKLERISYKNINNINTILNNTINENK